MSKILTNLTGDDLLLKDKSIIKAGKTEELENVIADELMAKYPKSLKVEGEAVSAELTEKEDTEDENQKESAETPVEKPRKKRKAK